MSGKADEAIQRIVGEMRRHFDFDVGFVSELRDGERIFRYVDTGLADSPVQAGGSDPAAASYCHYVVGGEIPELLRDPSQHPVASQLEATHRLPVGTHVSVPVVLPDGTVYGTLCCFSLAVVDSVADDQMSALRVIAAIVGEYLDVVEADRRQREQQRRRLQDLVPGRDLLTVCQPIVRLQRGDVVGMEALTRFPTLGEGPASVFARAWESGIGAEIELGAVEGALAELDRLPAGAYLSINAAPATLATDGFVEAVRASEPRRIVVEVTEHAMVEDYDALTDVTRLLAELGVRLAIDDVGTGFSGLNHIVRLTPDIIKIDGSLVRDIGHCNAKQAMLSALITFASRMATAVIAEGIETQQELTALRVLGVDFGQGYLFGRPRPLEREMTPCQRAVDAGGR